MAINNPGTNSVFLGVQTQSANSITHGIDVFTAGNVPPTNGYVTEDGITYYVAEDGVTYYVQEN